MNFKGLTFFLLYRKSCALDNLVAESKNQMVATVLVQQGCQTCVVTLSSYDILQLFSPSLKWRWGWPGRDVSSPQAASLKPLL